ncbi:MAG: bifunctional oligoribonuclease/PAP phosphatase NrnA [Mucinivorans sp.]
MENIFNKQKLEQLNSLISSANSVAVISHANPDGDAVGSSLAWSRFLSSAYPTKKVLAIVPNHYPAFLNWVDPMGEVAVFADTCDSSSEFLANADLIFIIDFNQTARLEKMSDAMQRNTSAKRVLIDHHIAPPQYELSFWATESCSTAFIVYNMIVKMVGTEALTKSIAEALYLGIMTDTGCFSYSHLTPELFRAVAVLVESGADPVFINRQVFNTQSQDRARLVGYLLSEKMNVISAKGAAYITLTSEEKLRFNHQIGDTEGVVNMPMTINGVCFSAMLIQTKDCIKLSLRSQGDLDVNIIAEQYFNGGGHRNAAGGKFFGTMEQAVAQIEKVIEQL